MFRFFLKSWVISLSLVLAGGLWACSKGEQIDPSLFVEVRPKKTKISAGTVVSFSLKQKQKAEIYYTLDDTEPNRESFRYKAPFSIWGTTSIHFAAFAEANRRGATASVLFQIDSVLPFTKIIPPPGTFRDPFSFSFQINEKALTFYTLNGKLPNSDSSIFRKPILISKDTLVQYYSVDLGKNQEPRQKAFFNFPPRLSFEPKSDVFETSFSISMRSNEKGTKILYRQYPYADANWLEYRAPLRIRTETEVQIKARDRFGVESKLYELHYGFLGALKQEAMLSWELQFGSRPEHCFFGDPDNFDKPSLFAVSKQALVRYAFDSKGKGSWHLLHRFSSPIKELRSWDLDGDGISDYILISSSGNLEVYLSDGQGKVKWNKELLKPEKAGTIFVSMLPIDFDGDGQLDILGLALQSERSGFWKRIGQSYKFQSKSNLKIAEGAVGALSADWNGDGKADILILPGKDRFPYMLYGKKKGLFQKFSFATFLAKQQTSVRWLHAAQADLNLDGELDLIFVGESQELGGKNKRLEYVFLSFQKGQGWRVLQRSNVAWKSPRGLLLFDLEQNGFQDLFIMMKDNSWLGFKNVLGLQLVKLKGNRPFLKDATLGCVGTFQMREGARLWLFSSKGKFASWKNHKRLGSLALILRGIRGNRSALGAQIQVFQEKRAWVFERNLCCTGQSLSDFTPPLGLGSFGKINKLRIRWSDGQVREVLFPKENRVLFVGPKP